MDHAKFTEKLSYAKLWRRKMNKRAKGKIGEDTASSYLAKNGYQILQRNYYTRYGEIDIIAKKDDTIVFVEVKKRANAKFGIGAEAVGQSKMKKIRICAQLYLQENMYIDQNIRFDVIDILSDAPKPITHIIAAF